MKTLNRTLVSAAAILAAGHAHAFTAEQVAAGRSTYAEICTVCHGATMRLLPASVLAGPEFVAKWGERTTSDLLTQVRNTMPPDRPGALSEVGSPGTELEFAL